MLAKKTKKYDFNKNSTLFFSLGLLCMSIFAYFTIELQVEQKTFSEIKNCPKTNEIIEDPITFYRIKTPQYKPLKTQQFVEQLKVVKKIGEPIEIKNDPEIEINSIIDPTKQIAKLNDNPIKYIDVTPTDIEVDFKDIYETPVFPGCENLSKEERDACFKENVLKHIQKNLRYPENALENEHQGRVNVQFIIEKDGTISIANLRGPYESLSKEASRVIKLLPKMKAGEQRNKTVKVSYTVPIVFKTQN
jgi:protein TonB